jgi:hypothetical protein
VYGTYLWRSRPKKDNEDSDREGCQFHFGDSSIHDPLMSGHRGSIVPDAFCRDDTPNMELFNYICDSSGQ